MPKNVLFLILGLLAAALASGVQFNELMQGYYSDGFDPDYQHAYEQGKQKNQNLYFKLTAVIPQIDQFLRNEDHPAQASGTLFFKDQTYQVEQGSTIELFDHGVHEHYVLNMRYYLAWRNENQEAFHLEGIKEINGNSCIHLVQMMTTLYVHVRTGIELGKGDIIATAIVMIDPLHIAEFALSFRGYQTSGIFESLVNLNKLLQFATKNVKDDCSNITALYESKFWYIWASDGQNGFLMDLIKRPNELELRLDIYQQGQKPVVYKQFLDSKYFHESNQSIAIGPVVLTRNSCNGSVSGVTLNNVQFTLSSQDMIFTPTWIENIVKILPMVQSQYGSLQAGAKVGPITLGALPMVYTWYTIPIGMGYWQWSLLSAQAFNGTDLKFETISVNLQGQWMSSSFVYYKGLVHRFNNPALFQSKLIANGEHVDTDGYRNFVTEVKTTLVLHLRVSCKAKDSDFAILETEGDTSIHTALFGACEAEDVKTGKKYTNTRNALLEVKYNNNK